ncbi:extracellular solute-binding protein [Paenibacillus sp. GCM10027626]|uniref:extracellular solute-binding protein n=1 Tax=Paenibacillus sp. GCM10027626 TaxID=3273411 RepID=UPI0036441FB5
MNKKKRFFSTMLLVLSVALGAAGCSKDAPANDSKGANRNGAGSGGEQQREKPFVLGEEPLSFSFYGNYDWFNMQPWGEDPATKWIKDNKKVTVEAISSGGAPEQKLNTMIASGELPDVIFLERGSDVERLRKAGKLVALDDYFEKYPNLRKWLDPSALQMLRSEDGKLYQFPNWHTTEPQGNGGYMINKGIYKALGSPKLETFDDLYAYLKLVKEKYPDVIPFETTIGGQGVDVLYSGFADDHPLLYLSQLAVPEGNELKSILSDPVYRESMLFASKLAREKLLTPDALTQTLDQVRERMTTGRVAVIAAYNVMNIGGQGNMGLRDEEQDESKKNDVGYQLIWPLHKEGVDKNKVWPTQYDKLGWNVSVITTAAKNPEGIFAYLDWQTGDEGQRVLTYGPEGLYWQGTDEIGTPIFKPEFYDDEKEYNRLYGVWDTFTWSANSSFHRSIKERVESQTPPEKAKKMAPPQPDYNLRTAFNGTAFVNLEPPAGSDEAIIAQKVDDIFKEARAKAIFAKSDEEVIALLDKAENDALKAGYDKLLKYKTERWQENLSKLNSGK